MPKDDFEIIDIKDPENPKEIKMEKKKSECICDGSRHIQCPVHR